MYYVEEVVWDGLIDDKGLRLEWGSWGKKRGGVDAKSRSSNSDGD